MPAEDFKEKYTEMTEVDLRLFVSSSKLLIINNLYKSDGDSYVV